MPDFPVDSASKLFKPCAEIENFRRRDDGQLIAPLICRQAHDASQDDSGIRRGVRGLAAGIDHFLRVFQKLWNIDTHHGTGHHAEIGKGGVASANARHAHEDFAEFIPLGDALHLRTRIGDGDEPVADFFFADFRFHAVEKVLLVDVWFQSASGFAGDDADRAVEVYFFFDGFNLGGIGGIQDVELGVARDFAERHSKNFGTQAGAAHSQQQACR